MGEEAQSREHCKRGRHYDAIDGSGITPSTREWEYEWYRKRLRARCTSFSEVGVGIAQ